MDERCICGHFIEEHAHDKSDPGAHECLVTGCDCGMFETEDDDEWDGDEDGDD